MNNQTVITNNRVNPRYVHAAKAAAIHLMLSIVVALGVAVFVFGIWYPFPYREMSGGRELFLLVIAVDIVCGPILTLVLFDKSKQSVELWRDLCLVALMQLAALGYGLWSVYEARPLYFVLEIDRFKVIAAPDLRPAALKELALLPPSLKPTFFSGPLIVALRESANEFERQEVLLESVAGGRDYAERPAFYTPYASAPASKLLARAKPLHMFVQKYPAKRVAVLQLLDKDSLDVNLLLYLPVVARQDWIAILDKEARIKGFIKGDGF